VNHLAITKRGRGGSEVAVIDSIIGGIRPMRTGIFAFLKSKKQAVNDSNFSFGKTVLEAVKNSKGTTEEELAGEMKGVLDSMSILKDCEAKTKLMDVVKDCFDNKEMALADEAELSATLDSMWIDIHSDSLGEIAKAFEKLGKKNEKPAEANVSDSADEGDEDKNKDSADKNKDGADKSKDSKDEGDEDKNKDSADEGDKDKDKDKDKNKDGCNKDSAFITKDDLLTAMKAELAPMVADAVKECLGLKDGKSSVEGSELDSTGKQEVRDYTSFLV
jgi:hypothetical protein